MVKKEISISEIGGFQIGHADDKEGVTGCTVLLFDECAPAGVDIRGGGPASSCLLYTSARSVMLAFTKRKFLRSMTGASVDRFPAYVRQSRQMMR